MNKVGICKHSCPRLSSYIRLHIKLQCPHTHKLFESKTQHTLMTHREYDIYRWITINFPRYAYVEQSWLGFLFEANMILITLLWLSDAIWWHSCWSHDDVIKWNHFPHYWPIVRGIHRSPVNSPRKDHWHGALMFSLLCAWISGWVNNRKAGDLRLHRAHYDVTVMNIVIAGGLLPCHMKPLPEPIITYFEYTSNIL